MRFETPEALLLLIFAPLLVPHVAENFFNLRHSRLLFAAPAFLSSTPHASTASRMRRFLKTALQIASYCALVLALARPQTGNAFVEIRASGRDILLLLDVSGSMEALDFTLQGEQVTRLEALKSVTADFIRGRAGDRLGIIVFGEHVFTQSPLTMDHRLIEELVKNLEIGMAGDGTALGDSIAVALQRLESIPTNSKVLLLVTDGMRTAGQLNPVEAARLAAKLGVKIHTIGIGGSGPAPFATKTLFGRSRIQYQDVPLDEKTLKEIANTTNGVYFNAQNTSQLEAVYAALDTLEPREETSEEYVEYQEQFQWFALAAAIALCFLGVVTLTRWSEHP